MKDRAPRIQNTEVAPVVPIVTEEEYIELFGTEMMTNCFMEIGVRLDWRVHRRHQRHSVEDDSIEAAESGQMKERSYSRERSDSTASKLCF